MGLPGHVTLEDAIHLRAIRRHHSSGVGITTTHRRAALFQLIDSWALASSSIVGSPGVGAMKVPHPAISGVRFAHRDVTGHRVHHLSW